MAASSPGRLETVVWQGREMEIVKDSYVLAMPRNEESPSSTTHSDGQVAVPSVEEGWTIKPIGLGYFELETPGATAAEVVSWSMQVGASSVAPNSTFRPLAAPTVLIPNDPFYLKGSQWGLVNKGQFGGVPDADIDAPEAWARNTGASDIVVAVLDSGIDYTHPDLQPNLWVRDRAGVAIPSTVTGQFGWDSVYGRGWGPERGPLPDNLSPLETIDWHGTAVAGVIGAEGDNRRGITGVCWDVALYSARVFVTPPPPDDITWNLNVDNVSFVGTAARFADAIVRIIELKKTYGQNFVAINCSWDCDDILNDDIFDGLINELNRWGILLVVAAGNDGGAVSDWSYENVITVAASDRNDILWAGSNVGADIAAPGVEIWSTVPRVLGNALKDLLPTEWLDFATGERANRGFGYANLSSPDFPGANCDLYYGTSMAAPHVTGVAALVAAQYRKWTRDLPSARFMRNAILAGADKVASLAGNVLSNRRLNAFGALVYTDENLPPGISVQGMKTLEGDSGETMLEFDVSLTQLRLTVGENQRYTQTYKEVAATKDIEVRYSTEDVTPTRRQLEAVAGEDYVPVVSGSFIIKAGTSNAKFRLVKVKGDAKFENNELVKIVLKRLGSLGVGSGDAWLRNDVAFGTILNDDPNAYFPAATVSTKMEVTENDPGVKVSNHSLVVQLNDGTGKSARRAVTLSYRVVPIEPIGADEGASDLAVAGKDFVAQAGRVTIPAGKSQALIPFRVLADGDREISKRFRIELLGAAPGVLKEDKKVCEVTIKDSTSTVPGPDPKPGVPPGLTITAPTSDSNTSVLEGTGSEKTVYFDVRLEFPVDTAVVASYSFLSGVSPADKTKSPAMQGADFVGQKGQVVLAPGQTSARIPVRIVGDRRVERDEWFTLRVNPNVKGAILVGGSDVLAQIKDDDGPVQASNAAMFAAAFAANEPSASSGTPTSARRPIPFR